MAQLQEMKHNHGKLKTDNKNSTEASKNKNSNGNGQGKNSKNAQGKGEQSTESSQETGKAQDSDKPHLTPDQKAAQGIIGTDDIETYKNEGRCFTCHTKGHMKQDYPKKISQKRIAVRRSPQILPQLMLLLDGFPTQSQRG